MHDLQLILLIIQNSLESLKRRQNQTTPLQVLNSGENCSGAGGYSMCSFTVKTGLIVVPNLAVTLVVV